jgi:hypothetical protein
MELEYLQMRVWRQTENNPTYTKIGHDLGVIQITETGKRTLQAQW